MKRNLCVLIIALVALLAMSACGGNNEPAANNQNDLPPATVNETPPAPTPTPEPITTPEPTPEPEPEIQPEDLFGFYILPAGVEGGFVFSQSGALITSYTGEGTHIIVPNTLGGYPVVGISGGPNFMTLGVTKTITLPDTVENFVLARHENISGHIEIPYGVTHIAGSPFEDMNEITGVYLPNTVISIGFRAFAHTSITEIRLPESILGIGTEAFVGSPLTSVYIPESVTELWLHLESFRHLPLDQASRDRILQLNPDSIF